MIQRVIQSNQLTILRTVKAGHTVKVFFLPPATLPDCPHSRGVHPYPPHQLNANGEKLRSAFPVDILDIHRPDIDLMHQGCSLQSASGALPFHKAAGETAELLVYARSQRVECLGAALRPF